MNAVFRGLINLALRKYKEPSTWIPIVAAIGAAVHVNISPELQTAIDSVFAAIVTALFVAINEHGKPADSGGSADSVREPAPAAPGNGSSGADLQAGNRPSVRPADEPKPVRPGFGKY